MLKTPAIKLTLRRSHSEEDDQQTLEDSSSVNNSKESNNASPRAVSEQMSIKSQNSHSSSLGSFKKKKKKGPIQEALDRAKTFSKHGQYDLAVEELDKAMVEIPDIGKNLTFFVNRGSYNFWSGQLEEALRDFDSALAIDSTVASIAFNKGNVLRSMNRDSEASQAFQLAVQLDPSLTEGHVMLAKILLKLNKPRLSVASIERALQLSPDHLVAHEIRMQALSKLGNTVDALSSVKILIESYGANKVPKNQRVKYSLVYCHAAEQYASKNQTKEALECAKEACGLNPSYSTYFCLGEQLTGVGSHEEAAKEFENASVCDESHYDAPLFQGACLVQIGRFDLALSPLKKAEKLVKERGMFDSGLSFYLGFTLVNLGRHQESVQYLMDVLNYSKEKPLPNNNATGILDVTSLSKAEELDMKKKAQTLLATSYLSCQEEAKAFKVLDEARKKYPTDAEIQFNAGYAATLIDENAKALECFSACLAINPNHDRAKQALAKLKPIQPLPPKGKPPGPPALSPPGVFPTQQVSAAAIKVIDKPMTSKKSATQAKLSKMGVVSGADAVRIVNESNQLPSPKPKLPWLEEAAKKKKEEEEVLKKQSPPSEKVLPAIPKRPALLKRESAPVVLTQAAKKPPLEENIVWSDLGNFVAQKKEPAEKIATTAKPPLLVKAKTVTTISSASKPASKVETVEAPPLKIENTPNLPQLKIDTTNLNGAIANATTAASSQAPGKATKEKDTSPKSATVPLKKESGNKLEKPKPAKAISSSKPSDTSSSSLADPSKLERASSASSNPTTPRSGNSELAEEIKKKKESEKKTRVKALSAKFEISSPVASLLDELFNTPSFSHAEQVAQILSDQGYQTLEDLNELSLEKFEKILKPGWASRLHRNLHPSSAGKAEEAGAYATNSEAPPKALRKHASDLSPSSSGGFAEIKKKTEGPIASTFTPPPEARPDFIRELQQSKEKIEQKNLLHQQQPSNNGNNARRASGKFLAELAEFNRDMLKKPIALEEPPPKDKETELMETIKRFSRDSLRKVDPKEKVGRKRGISQEGGLLGAMMSSMRNRRIIIEDIDFDSAQTASSRNLSHALDDEMFEADDATEWR